jgi:hypothetical protein
MQGLASGTNNALRELGGVLGIAVLSSVFAARGGYETTTTFIDGTRPALWIGVIALLIGVMVGLTIPRLRSAAATDAAEIDSDAPTAVESLSATPAARSAPVAATAPIS